MSGASGFLSDVDIREAIKAGKLQITPFKDERLGSWTYDVELGNIFKTPQYNSIKFIDPRLHHPDNMFHVVELKDDEEFVLHPHRFVLASTKEYIKLSDEVVSLLEGRSSFARWGIVPHVQAGIGEPGWEGQYTLEILNMNEVPVILRPGDVIAQLYFAKFITPSEKPYYKKEKSKYQGQVGPTASKLFIDFKKQ
ncbi:MAG: dCTP deaminase [Candidatus Aenigmarchaeota archaeon]|nr:dCTP deaminase [Candidatus Aenigmarchaeota archaeon]